MPKHSPHNLHVAQRHLQGISPGKSTELRMKNLQQLRVLQQLYDDSIVSDKELAEQKEIVLTALRKLV